MSEVNALALPPSIRNKLLQSGPATTSSLAHQAPTEIANAAHLSPQEAGVAVAAAQRSWQALQGARSAKALYDLERGCRRIITFCAALDGILGGGVAPRQLTELCGGPGIGKTQLCMQLALDVQIPKAFGGLGARALYVDAEGGLTPERVRDMAAGLAAHLCRIAGAKGGAERQQAAAAVTVDALLRGIDYYRVHSLVEQLAMVDALDTHLTADPGIRLVVLDSVAFHFRQEVQDPGTRARQLAQLAQTLLGLAARHDVAVVLTNHITTRLGQRGQPARLVPALGDSWAHAATSRLMLYWQDDSRRAFLYKSPSQPAAAAAFDITGEGVRGVRAARPSATKRAREEGR